MADGCCLDLRIKVRKKSQTLHRIFPSYTFPNHVSFFFVRAVKAFFFSQRHDYMEQVSTTNLLPIPGDSKWKLAIMDCINLLKAFLSLV